MTIQLVIFYYFFETTQGKFSAWLEPSEHQEEVHTNTDETA